MALADRLARAVSTTAFRVAATTVAAYLAFAGLVVGVLLWQTNRVLYEPGAVDPALRGRAAEG